MIMTLKERNVLLATFMNWKLDGVFYRPETRLFNPITYSVNSHHEEQLCFHLSWDWLMPVCVKIIKLAEPIGGKHSDLEYNDRWNDWQKLRHAILSGDIEKAFEAVVKAVEKYGK
jgi:hypothetical protein